MFGLMQPKSCSVSTPPAKNFYTFHRMHYCGTCKAIGLQFDQSSRIFLNFDTVFLAELLSLLNNEQTEHWEQHLQQVNTCLSMPTEALPFSLQYAAAINLLLGELKIKDNIIDNKAFLWKIAQKYFSKSFKKTAKQFKYWNIDLRIIYQWAATQEDREKKPITFASIQETLAYYAEATATTTGILFLEGGKYISENLDLYELGYQFGQLMYVLDAFEDYEKDIFQQQFNPFAILFQEKKTIPQNQLEVIRSIILEQQKQCLAQISILPIEGHFKTLYQNRLQSNIALRIYKKRKIPTSPKEQIQLRWKRAKGFAEQVTCQSPIWTGQVNYYAIALAVFISPNTSDFLPQNAKAEVLTWTALISASIASMGWAYAVRKNRKEQRKRRQKQKKRQRLIKRFGRKLKRFIRKEKNYDSECCDDCCDNCCSEECTQGCCDTCCKPCIGACFTGICEAINNSENPWLWWLLIIGSATIAIGLGILIAILI